MYSVINYVDCSESTLIKEHNNQRNFDIQKQFV